MEPVVDEVFEGAKAYTKTLLFFLEKEVLGSMKSSDSLKLRQMTFELQRIYDKFSER